MTAGTAVSGTRQPLTAGATETTITEAQPPAGFVLGGISCTGLGAEGTATPTITAGGASGGSVLLNAASTASGSDIVCTFSNSVSADLSISKTNNATTLVPAQTTRYVLVVTNNGAGAVTGAVVTDTPVAGLTCPAGNPVTVTGPGAPGGATTVGTLVGSGVTLGRLGAGESVTLSFDCTVQ